MKIIDAIILLFFYQIQVELVLNNGPGSYDPGSYGPGRHGSGRYGQGSYVPGEVINFRYLEIFKGS